MALMLERTRREIQSPLRRQTSVQAKTEFASQHSRLAANAHARRQQDESRRREETELVTTIQERYRSELERRLQKPQQDANSPSEQPKQELQACCCAAVRAAALLPRQLHCSPHFTRRIIRSSSHLESSEQLMQELLQAAPI